MIASGADGREVRVTARQYGSRVTSGQYDSADVLAYAAQIAAAYRATVRDHPVGIPVDPDVVRARFGGPLPAGPTSPRDVIDALVAAATPGLVATVGPRYFGFVIGGALPAATAADIVAAGWDQSGFSQVLSPAAAAAEEAAGTWLAELLGLPPTVSVGFVTGAQGGNTVGIAAARQRVLADAGWDVSRRGLRGAPLVRVVAGVERHATIDRAVRLLGLGDSVIEEVAADAHGSIDVDDLARVLASGTGGPVIVCLQAGNVNTGACDDLRSAITVARGQGAWVHVDGAFGLWAGAVPELRHLVDGVELADSWSCDGHKWLNVPYDAGYAFCAHPDVHVEAVSYTAPYLVGGSVLGRADLTLESSRRARGFATWAALRELGRDGVADLVRRCCGHARRFAAGLAAGGAEIANEVVLNQVLVAFGDDARTDRVIDAVQRDGTCWMGGTTWRGRRYMRISVSNWSTTDEDVDRSLGAVLRAAAL
jgi:glutamate/tyrosine decarboxylase-like PLP-dependent enzyme